MENKQPSLSDEIVDNIFISTGSVKEAIKILLDDFKDWKEYESIKQKFQDRMGDKLCS